MTLFIDSNCVLLEAKIKVDTAEAYQGPLIPKSKILATAPVCTRLVTDLFTTTLLAFF